MTRIKTGAAERAAMRTLGSTARNASGPAPTGAAAAKIPNRSVSATVCNAMWTLIERSGIHRESVDLSTPAPSVG
jgi:hypothetical protein